MAERKRPDVQPYPMPAVSYYALPPFLVAFAVLVPYTLLTGQDPFEGPAWLWVPLIAVYTVLVGIPMVASFVRVLVTNLQSASPWRNTVLFLSRMIYILKVPDTISARHGWFKYVYYGSFVAYGFCTIMAVPAYSLWIVLKPLQAAAWEGRRAVWGGVGPEWSTAEAHPRAACPDRRPSALQRGGSGDPPRERGGRAAGAARRQLQRLPVGQGQEGA